MTRLSTLRAWRDRRLLRREAHHLVKEARRIQRRYAHRLTAVQAAALGERAAHLVLALRGAEPLDPAIELLGDLLDGELAFAKKSAAREYVESIGGVVFIALLLRSFVVEAYQIPSGSMIPTLQVGDHIWVNKMIYGLRIPFTEVKLATHWREPKRGEIVVFTHPRERDKDLIKRVVGVGGDVVELSNNVLTVNGVALAHRHDGAMHYFDFDEGADQWFERDATKYHDKVGQAEFTTLQDPLLAPRTFGPVRVPEGQLFVMGDNRDNSSDSRYWGFVPLNLVRGRAMVVWWSRGEPEGVRFRRFGHLIE
ncbi:MAG: signal peptidase [Myxococcales bacterium]|nr:signal peptidase [Myxococcales bacterium]